MKTKVSLVLSGGGARGIAHIGVIEELEREGYEIHSVAGTSMGALVGGVYSVGKLDEFKNWMFTLDMLKVFNLVDFTLSKQGLVKGDKVLKEMKKFIPDTLIEELEIQYAAVAVDILKKEEVVFREGSMYDAIRASISIPTVFTPMKMGERMLVDGGVLNNIPVNHAKREPGDILVAVNVNANVEVDKPVLPDVESELNKSIYSTKLTEFYDQLKKYTSSKIIVPNESTSIGYFDLMNKTISMMMTRITELSFAQYSPDVLVNISNKSSGTFDFYKAEELVGIGRLAAQKALKSFNDKEEK